MKGVIGSRNGFMQSRVAAKLAVQSFMYHWIFGSSLTRPLESLPQPVVTNCGSTKLSPERVGVTSTGNPTV